MNMDEMAAGRARMQQQRPDRQSAADGTRPTGTRTQGVRPGGGDRPGTPPSREEMEQRRQEMQKLTVPMKMWVKSVALAEND